MKSTFLFLLVWGLILFLCLNNLKQSIEIDKLKQKCESQEQEVHRIIEATDNELSLYGALQEENHLLVRTVTDYDLKQTKIREVREIVRNTISLPHTEVTRIAKYIVEYSDQYDIPLNLAVALIKQESAFDIRAVSSAGAQGLTQLMPETANLIRKQLGKSEYDPWDSQDNIQFGLFYFSTLLDLYKGRPEQYRLAVNAYNAGPGNVFKVLHRETIEHETYIFRYASEFKSKGL